MLLQNIKKLCKDRHISLAELERLAEIPTRSLQHWDRVMPAADKLLKVADVLEVDAKALITEDMCAESKKENE